MESNAVGSEIIASIIGYNFKQGDFSENTPNLPQRIAVIAEGNSANQGSMPSSGVQILNLKEAGDKFGYGSPAYHVLRILKPLNGPGVGGIPVIVYPQPQAVGATARVQTITVTGTATANGSHSVVVGGRYILDGASYSYTVNKDDTPTVIAGKIVDAINGVIGSPLTASSLAGVVTVTTKWQGATSQGVNVFIDQFETSTGVTYAVNESAAGAGTPAAGPALNMFGSAWNTIVVNTHDISVSTILDELESFNGIPDPVSPTGLFAGTVMRPFVALTGSVNQNDTLITDARRDQLTVALCPAPLSEALPMEAAANMCVKLARQAQDMPHADVQDQFYPDMPAPLDQVIQMDDHDIRNAYLMKGSSTVTLSGGRYKIKDFATTYHPVGESIPAYRFVRRLVIDTNIRFKYYIREEQNVVGKTIVSDDQPVKVSGVVKPKNWKAVLKQSFAKELGEAGLIADVPFMQENITVGLSGSNPDRLSTVFSYKISGFGRILATTAEAGFNLG